MVQFVSRHAELLVQPLLERVLRRCRLRLLLLQELSLRLLERAEANSADQSKQRAVDEDGEHGVVLEQVEHQEQGAKQSAWKEMCFKMTKIEFWSG